MKYTEYVSQRVYRILKAVFPLHGKCSRNEFYFANNCTLRFRISFPVKIILPRKFKIKSNMAFKLRKRTKMVLLMRRRTIAKNKYKKAILGEKDFFKNGNRKESTICCCKTCVCMTMNTFLNVSE